MKEERRVLVKAYVRPSLKLRLDDLAARANMSSSRLVEQLLENGKYPDLENARNIQSLLEVNADQARLGNLMLKSINETADGILVSRMQGLLQEIRATQSKLKQCVARIRP